MNQQEFEKNTVGQKIGYCGPEKESEGLQFYRCCTCQSIISRWDIKIGGCKKCSGNKLVATNLSFIEKIIQIIKHPMIWKWGE